MLFKVNFGSPIYPVLFNVYYGKRSILGGVMGEGGLGGVVRRFLIQIVLIKSQ